MSAAGKLDDGGFSIVTEPSNAPANDTADDGGFTLVSEAAPEGASRTEYLGRSLGAGLVSVFGSGARVLGDVYGSLFGLNVEEAEALQKADVENGAAKPFDAQAFRDGYSPNAALDRISQGAQGVSTGIMQGTSEPTKAKYATLEYATLDPDKSAFLSPTRMLGDVLQSLPSTVALAVTARFGGQAGQSAFKDAMAGGATEAVARQAAIAAAAKNIATVGAVSEGGLGYAQQALSTQEQVKRIPQEKLDQSPEYKDLRQQGYDAAAARDILAERAGNMAGFIAGLVDAGTNLASGPVMGRVIGEGGKVIPRIAKGAATEAAQETVQSAGEQIGGNVAERRADPDKAIWDGVLESALQGAALGGITGGAAAGVFGGGAHGDEPAATGSPARPLPTRTIPTSPEAVADEVMAAPSVDDAIAAAAAIAQAPVSARPAAGGDTSLDWQAVFDDEDATQQIGWHNRRTGEMRSLEEGPAPAAPSPAQAPVYKESDQALSGANVPQGTLEVTTPPPSEIPANPAVSSEIRQDLADSAAIVPPAGPDQVVDPNRVIADAAAATSLRPGSSLESLPAAIASAWETVRPGPGGDIPAALRAAADDTPAAPVTFQTAKGSTYVVHGDGTTTRDKAPRADLGHEGQSGPQPRSQATFYVTPAQADALSLIQTTGAAPMALKPMREGQWGITYMSGKDTGKVERRTVITPAAKPAVGLLPVEVFNKGRTVHFGNEITAVGTQPAASVAGENLNTPAAAGPVAPTTMPLQSDYNPVVAPSGKLRGAPRRLSEDDVASFLAARGGIRNDESHDLIKGRGLQQMVPGRGPLIRSSGLSIDGAGEVLHEAGFFGPPETTPRPTENEVLQLLEQTGRGTDGKARKVFRAEQAAKIAEQRAGDLAEEQNAAARAEIQTVGAQYGEALTEGEIDQILANMGARDLDAEDALVEHLERKAIQEENADYESATAAPAAGEPVPGGEGAPDRAAGESVERPAPVAGNESAAEEAREPAAPDSEEARPLAAERGADGLDQTILVGAEHSARQMAKSREDAGHGKVRAAAPQKDAGGMFAPKLEQTKDIFSQPEKAATTPAPTSTGIEDFGEVLTGARKHYAEAYRDRMTEAAEVDIAAEPLSKSWPEPDYQKMLDDGADPWLVGFIHSARDEVPTKPQKSWKLKGWVESVQTLRKFSNDLLNGAITKDALQAALNNSARLRSEILGRVDLYEAVGHSKSLKGIRLYAGSYSLYKGVKYSPNKTIWSVEKEQKATAFSNWPRILGEGETREEAIKAFKSQYATMGDEPRTSEVRFDLYWHGQSENKKVYIGKKIGRGYIDLKAFDNVRSARLYMAEHKAELAALLERKKSIPNERRENNSPRVGADHRGGANVTPQQFSETFGFRGVQFGNYVEGARRQDDLNEAYDALLDMAGILNIPAKSISLNGELGLAFGARGTGGLRPAKAHYEPSTVVINLTKANGAGSLAHEWWHSLDNYFSRARSERAGFVTASPVEHGPGIRAEMLKAFQGIVTAIKQTALQKRSSVLDARRSSPYWTTPHEMTARSFESYIIAKLQDQSASNDYLANIVSEDFWKAAEALGMEGDGGQTPSYPYLTPAEIPAVRTAYDNFFSAVETKEGEGGAIAMFSRRDDAMGPVEAVSRFRDLQPFAARKAAERYALDNLRGTYVNADTGWDIVLSRAGIKKTLEGDGSMVRAEIAANLPALLKSATLADTHADVDARPDVAAVHRFRTQFVLDGRVNDVLLTVKQDTAGTNRHYAVEHVEVEPAGKRLPAGNTYEHTPAPGENIPPDGEGFNKPEIPRVSGLFSSEFDAQREAVGAELRKRLDDLGLKDIALKLPDAIRVEQGGTVTNEDGAYAAKIIAVALDAKDAAGTLDHEAIHAFKALGLFNKSEWSMLANRAAREWRAKFKIDSRYSDLSEEKQNEEAVAEAFREWAKDARTQKGTFARIFDKVRNALSAIGSVLRGRGFQTHESIFGRIERGEVGARERGADGDGSEPMFDRRERPQAGIFDRMAVDPARSTVEHLTDSSRALVDRLRTGLSREAISESMDRFRTAFQDRYLPMLRVQTAVERQIGRPLSEDQNPYLKEELSTGRKGAKLEALAEGMIHPLFLDMQEKGVSVAELESYLYARHAPERNARIDKINPAFRGDMLDDAKAGSGMSNEEAAGIMAAAERASKIRALEALAKRVDGILSYGVEQRVEAGLLSQAEAEAWKQSYKHYVPLRGHAELDPQGDAAFPRVGRPLSVKGRESQRAFGRESKASDILAYSIMQAEEAIVRGENNRIAQAFHALAKAAPNPDFWTLDKVENRPVWNKAAQTVEYRPVDRISAEDAAYTISLKIDGVEHRVTLNRNNPAAVRLAEGMKSLGSDQAGLLIHTFGAINRFLSHVNTTLNPEFVITNAFRDIQEASINLNQFQIEGIVKNTIRDYPKALKGSLQGAFKKGDGEWRKTYDEFRAAGGRVYFNQTEDIPGLRTRIEREVQDAKPGVTAFKAVKSIFNFIESANLGVENAVRLSAFKNAREAGMSPSQAASLAKNLTINFNRRGTYGPLMNSLYLFYNASVQGTAVMLTAMKSSKVRKIAYGIVATGAMLEILNAMMSGTDDDGELFYDKVDDYTKSHNLVLMDPTSDTGRFFKIPLPYGYGSFFAMGRAGAEMQRGKDFATAIGNLGTTIMDSFNPVGGAGTLINLIAPTAIDPLVDLFATNRDYAGKPIMPDQPQYGPPIPDNQRYWGSVSPYFKGITDTLNKLTGGDDVVPGTIDVSPETLQYLFGVVTGAAGSFYERNADLVAKVLDPTEDVTFNDIPLARKVVGSKPSWVDKQAMYQRTEEIEQVRDQVKDYRKTGRPAEATALLEKNRDLLSMAGQANAARDQLGNLRHQLAAAQRDMENGKIGKGDFQTRKKAIQDRELAIITRFNGAFNARTAEPVN